MTTTHPPGPAMTLGNMRELGVQRLIASCLNDACRHTALIIRRGPGCLWAKAGFVLGKCKGVEPVSGYRPCAQWLTPN
jgi:hypothetical protein